MENDRMRAAADLAALDADRAALADRARQPWWYDPALGVLVAAFLSTYSFGYPGVTLVALVPFGIWVGLLMAAYKRRAGFWVNGWRAGATRQLVVTWFAGYLVVLVGGLVAELGFGIRYSMVVVGVVVGVSAALLSRCWTTVYQRELRERV